MLSNWDSRGPNREHWWSRSREYGIAETLQGKMIPWCHLWHSHHGLLTRSHRVSLGHLEPSTLRLRGRWSSVTQSCACSERGEARRKSCHFNSVSGETKGALSLAEELQPCVVLGLVGHTSSYVQRFYQGKSCLPVCISHTAEATAGRTTCQNHTSHLGSQCYCFVTILL